MRQLLFAQLLISLLSTVARAQNDPQLPRYLSPQEQWELQFSSDKPAPTGAVIGTPPVQPVRAMAEWEELQALVITWRGFSDILAEIVRAARQECRVIILCNDQNTINSAKNYLISAAVDISSNVEFLLAANNSIWVRDYGPNCVYANDVDSLYIIDWIYNRPSRPQDNTTPEKIGNFLNLPVYGTSIAPYEMVHTGGNFMSDGFHTGFSSRLILDENKPNNPYGTTGQTEVQIDSIMHGFMGINRYIKMQPLPYDVIHHIDMHMKLLDEETLLVGQYAQNVADGQQIEANIQYVLNNYKTCFGTPYKVIRIPMPPENGLYPNNGGDYRTYANAVFVNKTVILPFYEEKFDTTAQRIWQSALPGYKIVGINCNSIIPSLGAIHCITKEIGVNDPLFILHKKLECADNTLSPDGYPVFATLQHRSGISSAQVFYTTDLNKPWKMLDMQQVTGDTAHVWNAYIPKQAEGATVYYYIQATTQNGKVSRRPLPAPAGWWKFCVTESTAVQESNGSAIQEIYPNPASAITCVPVQCARATKGRLLLLNAAGTQQAVLFEGSFPAGDSNQFFDAARFVPGIYFLQLQTEWGTSVKKVLVH